MTFGRRLGNTDTPRVPTFNGTTRRGDNDANRSRRLANPILTPPSRLFRLVQ